MEKEMPISILGLENNIPINTTTDKVNTFSNILEKSLLYTSPTYYLGNKASEIFNTKRPDIELLYPEGYEKPIIEVPTDNTGNPIKFSIPKENPELVFVIRANKKVKNKTKEELFNEITNLNNDDVVKIQEELALEGYYDIDLSKGKNPNAYTIQNILLQNDYLQKQDVDGIIGKQTTSQLQKLLIDKGYLPEKTERGNSNMDGIIGKNTREAFKQYYRDYNIDGIAGNKTIQAYIERETKNKENNPFSVEVSAEGMEDKCAQWVIKKYDVVTEEQSKQNGVYGNAWNMLKNIEDSGGTMLFNIYNSGDFDDIKDSKSLKTATEKSIRNNNIDYSKLQAGDVVGIYVPSSSHHSDVLESGTTYNTHVGIVTDVIDGVPIIEHNISGKVRKERVDKLTGSRYGRTAVTVAARPKWGGQIKGEMEFQNIKSDLKYPEKYKNDLMDEYVDALASSKELYKDVFPTVDLDFIEKAAIAITKRETNYMTRKQSDVRSDYKHPMDMGKAYLRSIYHNVKETPEELISRDLTKIKFASLPPNYRTAIGLEDPKQLDEDPTIAGRAVMMLLAKNYEYFNRLALENPKLGLTKEDIENATIFSYNTGLGKLASLGFNTEDGSFNPEELSYLRSSSDPKVRERNISATNFKHFDRIGLGGLGNYLYIKNDAYEKGVKPYIASAREQINILNTLNNM